MANVITLKSPSRLDYVNNFIDQFTQNRKADEERKFREQQAAQQAAHWSALEGFQGQQVANDTTRLGNETTAAATEDRIKRGVAVITEINRLKDAGDIPGAQKVLATALQQDPELGKINLNLLLAGGETSLDRANANVGRFSETQTGIAAGGGTDPNAVNFTTKKATGAFMPTEGFTQQQATNLQARGGGSTAAIPGPTGDAVTDYERRTTGAMPTSAQNQTAATDITTTGMREAGATKRTAITAAGSRNAQAMSQGEAIAGEIIAGRQPPVVQSRTMEGPVRAALAAQGYDLTKATQDWKATERYLSTLNGPGQVRLRQAVDFAYESLGLVKDLAGQWKGGRFPLLNKVTLQAAKQGAMGPDAQAIATKLDSQIVEMQSELSVVYRGGNSPTDESLKQAAKVLQSNWSLPTLLANVDLLEKNLEIRRNSIVTAGVGANAGNRYAPEVTIPRPGERPLTSGGKNPLGLTPPH